MKKITVSAPGKLMLLTYHKDPKKILNYVKKNNFVDFNYFAETGKIKLL